MQISCRHQTQIYYWTLNKNSRKKNENWKTKNKTPQQIEGGLTNDAWLVDYRITD